MVLIGQKVTPTRLSIFLLLKLLDGDSNWSNMDELLLGLVCLSIESALFICMRQRVDMR